MNTEEKKSVQSGNEPLELAVTVSVTMSRTIKVKLTDYENTQVTDSEGNLLYEKFIFTPATLDDCVKKNIYTLDDIISDIAIPWDIKADISEWHIDEFETIPDQTLDNTKKYVL